jgi:periplasmic divalent cation tolerance protein
VRDKYIAVYTTFPNMRTAKKIISALVKNRLAACGNIFRLFSVYRWKEKIEKHPEYGALIKTRASKYRSVEKYIKDHHPYDVPEIISWYITYGSQEYLDWIYKVTG